VVTLRKASSSVLGLYFSGTLQENKRFVLYGAIETIPQIRGGEECRRFGQLAKTEEQRKILLQMEVVWAKLAEEAEGRAAKSQD
jgi:hypothetical protein